MSIWLSAVHCVVVICLIFSGQAYAQAGSAKAAKPVQGKFNIVWRNTQGIPGFRGKVTLSNSGRQLMNRHHQGLFSLDIQPANTRVAQRALGFFDGKNMHILVHLGQDSLNKEATVTDFLKQKIDEQGRCYFQVTLQYKDREKHPFISSFNQLWLVENGNTTVLLSGGQTLPQTPGLKVRSSFSGHFHFNDRGQAIGAGINLEDSKGKNMSQSVLLIDKEGVKPLAYKDMSLAVDDKTLKVNSLSTYQPIFNDAGQVVFVNVPKPSLSTVFEEITNQVIVADGQSAREIHTGMLPYMEPLLVGTINYAAINNTGQIFVGVRIGYLSDEGKKVYDPNAPQYFYRVEPDGSPVLIIRIGLPDINADINEPLGYSDPYINFDENGRYCVITTKEKHISPQNRYLYNIPSRLLYHDGKKIQPLFESKTPITQGNIAKVRRVLLTTFKPAKPDQLVVMLGVYYNGTFEDAPTQDNAWVLWDKQHGSVQIPLSPPDTAYRYSPGETTDLNISQSGDAFYTSTYALIFWEPPAPF